MGAPDLAQQREGAVGERDEPILPALAAVHVEQLASAVDGRHPEPQPLQQAQSAGVDERQADAVAQGPHRREHPTDLLLAQHDREPLLALRARQLEHGPVAAKRLLVEELDAAQGLREAARGDLPDVGQVQQVVADLLLGDPVGRDPVEPGQLGDGVEVGLDRAVRVAAKLQVFRHASAKRCHPILSEKVERT